MSWLVCAERVSFTAKSMSIIYIHSRLLGSNTFSNAALHVLKPEKPKTRPRSAHLGICRHTAWSTRDQIQMGVCYQILIRWNH